MRLSLVAASVVASLFFVACGGGGSGGGGGTAASGVAGTVIKRNGSTSNLAGVQISCTESGSSDISDASGKFTLTIPHGTVLHLDVKDPEATGGDKGGEGDCSENGDDTPDASDIKGGEVEVGEVGDGESCDIEIEVDNGEIVGVHMSKHDGKGGSDNSGEGVLFPPVKDGSYGEVEVRDENGCMRVEIESRGLVAGSTYDVSLVGPNGLSAALLGHFTVNQESEGHFVFEACGASLPLGALSVADLAGSTLLIQNSVGGEVLSGDFPVPGTEKDDGKDGGSKDGEDGGDKGGDDGGGDK